MPGDGLPRPDDPDVLADLTLLFRATLGCVLARAEHPDLWGERAARERAARLEVYHAVRRLYLAIPGNDTERWRAYAGALAAELGRSAQYVGLERAASGQEVSPS